MSIASVSGRLTRDPEAFESFMSSDASLIFSDSEHSSDWVIDLSVGDLWADGATAEPPRMHPIAGGELTIPSRSSVLVEVKEELRIPNNLYGLLLPKGRLFLEHGILMATARIDPRYEGRLRILLFNTSQRAQVVPRGTVIASCLFLRTDRTLHARHPLTRPAPIRRAQSRFERAKFFTRNNYKWILTTMIAVAALLVSLFKS